MTIKTVLADDDINARKAARAMLAPYARIEIVGEAENTAELVKLLSSIEVNLVFLDIEMGEEHGFHIAKLLQSQYPDVLYIFLTGHASYAIDGYDFQPVGFLTKPINKEKLSRNLEEVVRRIENAQLVAEDLPKLMFHSQTGYILVDVDNLLYVERRNRKNYLVTTTGEIRIYRYTLTELTDMLSPYGFYCCHQSYLVALSKILAIRDEGKQLYYLEMVSTDRRIPLSRVKYQECKQKLLERGTRIL